MYVCICKGITDSQIKQAVSGGARSFHQVSDELGVSTHCGSCASLAAQIVDDTISELSDGARFYKVA